MRIWSLHPQYLDRAGLVALWRETLLARAVLSGATTGYRHHPQLERFRSARDPVAAIDRYLAAVHAESLRRGYHFDATKFVTRRAAVPLRVSAGQLAYEWSHLKRKLRTRDPARYREALRGGDPEPHPIFRVVPGAVEAWERPTLAYGAP